MKKLVIAMMISLFTVAYAGDIVVDQEKSKNLHIDKAPNNVPLVNIEAPNSQGTSHNVFREYNVGKEGVILNNALDLENSKLGGLIYGNPNLQKDRKTASTILTEISGTHRSKLEGFTEIVGGKADYILANPNGIYINGAGFINTGNVKMMTAGSQNNFEVESGKIEIAGKGLDVRNINKAELIARVAELSAHIYGGEELNIALGSKSQKDKPEYSLDARALGSMYAGRIHIVSSEDGVGVKSAAPMYATKGDVILDTKGKVYLKDTQAKNNISIKAKETQVEEKLIAEKGIKLASEKIRNRGNLVANTNIIMQGDVENEKWIFSNGTVNISGNIKNKGEIKAKHHITLRGEELENRGLILSHQNLNIHSRDIHNFDKLIAENNVEIENDRIKNIGKIYSDQNIKINSRKIENHKDILALGNIELESKTLVNNEKIQANGNIHIRSKNIESENIFANYVTINTDTIESNKIITQGNIDIHAQKIKNRGKTYSKENTNIVAKEIENLGEMTSSGKIDIDTTKMDTNKILAKQDIHIKAKKLKTKEKIYSENNITINSDEIENHKDMLALGNIHMENKTLINHERIQANGNITIQSKELTSAGSIVNKGLIQSKNNVTLTAKEIQNHKKILSEQDITLESKTLKNLDHIAGKNKVNIKNENLDNKHVIYSDNQLEINSNEVDLHEKIAAKNLLKLHTKNLKRDKAYITNSDIEINIDGNYENNFELIGKNFTLTAKDVINNSIIAGREKVTITGKNGFTNKENSLLYSGNDLELSGKHLENQGDIAAGRNLKFQFSGDIKNLTANIEAGGDIYVKAMNFVNQGHITGDYSKRWVRGYENNIDVSKLPKEFLTKIDKILERKRHGRKFRSWDEDKRLKYAEQGVSHYISHKSYLKAGGDIQLEIAKDIRNQEADILADKNISIKAERLINTREGKEIPILLDFARRYHYRYWRHGKNRTGHGNIHARKYWKETLYSDKSTQIIAGANISIAANRIGNGEEKAYTTSSHLNSIHAPNKTNNVHPEDTFTNHSSIDETFHVNHNSLVKKIKQDSSIGVTDYIDIPKNDHGMFIVNKEKKNPKFSYLIETNPKMIEKGFYLSSEYFFSRIHFNPDRDIRLLGDSFYENKLITKAVLEGTGKRFLYSNNVNEERKKLFDNAVAAQKDLNLSLGIALSKEQINHLKSDILWYVEEVVNGEKVLVPKLYLSKNTLKSIVEEQGNIMKAGGSFVINNASIVDNSGKILAKNNVIVNSKNIYQNATYSDTGIYATNIGLVAEENIENIGGNMIAAKDISMYSENGEIKNRKKLSIHENDLRHIFTDVRASGNITGKNVKIVANTVENLGADIKAKENLEIGVRKNLEIGSLEAVEQRKSVGKKHTVLDRKTSNVGSKLQAKEIHLTTLQDIHVRGSNLFAEEKVNLSAKGNIDIVAGKNTTLHQEEHHKSKSFGRSSSSTDVEYSTESVASNVIGDKVNITSGKDISLLGSHIQANTEGNIVADGNITQAGVKDIHYSFQETSKRGAFGLTKKTKSQESYQEEAVKSATVAGEQGAYYDAKHDLVLEGVNVVSTGKVILQGKNISLKPLETTSWTEVKEKKRGFAGSIGNGGVSVSYGTDKKSQKDTQKTQNISEITSGKTLTIAAEETLTGSSVNLYGREGVRLTGEEGVHLSTAKNTREVQQKQSSTRVGANIGVKSELLNTVENIKNVDKLIDFSGDSYQIANTASQLVGAIKNGAAATNNIISKKYKEKADSVKSSNLEGISTNWKDYLSAGVSLTKKKAESRSYQEEVVQNQIGSEGNIVLSSKQGSISLEGTEIKTPKDVKLLAKEKVEVKAAEQKNVFSSSSSQRGAVLDMNGSLTASASGQKGRGEGTSYVNSHIQTGGDYQVLAKEILHEGANVKAGTIHMKGEKILVASKQDTSRQKDSSYGGSLSFSVNPKVALNSVQLSANQGKGKGAWVSEQTSLLAEHGGEMVAEHLENRGAIFASESETDKLKVSVNHLEVHDLEDSHHYENRGGGVSLSSKVPNISVSHDKIEKEQKTRATAVNTEFVIAGEEKKAEELGFNTELSKAQEISKEKEKHLNAELHTDLLEKEEYEKIVSAGRKLKAVGEALVSEGRGGKYNSFKEGLYGIYVDEFKKAHEKEWNLVKDTSLDPQKRLAILRKLQTEFYVNHGYTGVLPEILLTTEARSFIQDGRNEKGEKQAEKIFLSIENLNDEEIGAAFLVAHETAHLNTYEEGKSGEESSLYTRSKVDKEDKKQQFSAAEKEKYLQSIEKYEEKRTIAEQTAEGKAIPEEEREHFSKEELGDFVVGFGGALSQDLTYNTYKIDEKYLPQTNAYHYGKTFGHSASTIVGYIGANIGGGMNGGGMAFAPVTGGSSLVVIPVGTAVQGYFTGVLVTAGINATIEKEQAVTREVYKGNDDSSHSEKKERVSDSEKVEEKISSDYKTKAGKKKVEKVLEEGQSLEQHNQKYRVENIKNKKIQVGGTQEHTNKTAGHWEKMVDIAEEAAKNPKVKKVYLNERLHKISPEKFKNNRLSPDVVIEYENETFKFIEVQSTTDSERLLNVKLQNLQKKYGKDTIINFKVVDPKGGQ